MNPIEGTLSILIIQLYEPNYYGELLYILSKFTRTIKVELTREKVVFFILYIAFDYVYGHDKATRDKDKIARITIGRDRKRDSTSFNGYLLRDQSSLFDNAVEALIREFI